MNKLSELISEVVKKLFSISKTVDLNRPSNEFGDYATNIAMQISGVLNKNPREIAEAIAGELQGEEFIDSVTVDGPGFINVKLKPKFLEQYLTSIWSENYGSNKSGDGKTVVIDFPSPNMAKPYSVGHLRPGNQGWAAKRLMEETGWKVLTDNHLGDYGAPFGIWTVGFLKHSSDEKLQNDGVYELGRIYMLMKSELEAEKQRGETYLADEVQNWLMKLEASDLEAQEYSQKFNRISLDHIHEIMSRLRISTDYELGEAYFAPRGKDIVRELIEKGIATQNDDGSVIVLLDEEGIDVPMLVQKSNGTALYATTDIATLEYRQENWKPDRVIYCVGAEQQFHFKQLFAVAKKMGYDTELIHLWFGVIDQLNDDGTREKMSSRKGVVLMKELLDTAEARARGIVKEREISEEDIRSIALGAVKFSDFMSDRRTNILFNWDSIFALSGYSGPYVQYSAVRINKILNDNQINHIDTSSYDYLAEKEVLLKILDYPGVVEMAARDLEPHKIASYLFELSKVMNRYYESTPIATVEVDEVQKEARLVVLQKVSHVFKHGLSILGIDVPKTM